MECRGDGKRWRVVGLNGLFISAPSLTGNIEAIPSGEEGIPSRWDGESPPLQGEIGRHRVFDLRRVSPSDF